MAMSSLQEGRTGDATTVNIPQEWESSVAVGIPWRNKKTSGRGTRDQVCCKA